MAATKPITRITTEERSTALATMTAGRLTNLYDLMDSAYDAPEIEAKSRALGHVPIIDPNPRRGGKADAEAEARQAACRPRSR